MTRRPTIEWQVCGHCNYSCSYCIQSPMHRRGSPTPGEIERFLSFFASLPDAWEIKMSGGEPFSLSSFLEIIVPGLVKNTPHTISVLTNLSPSLDALMRFASMTRGRLGIVSASLHLEFEDTASFLKKALVLRAHMDPAASLVINSVLVPGRMEEFVRAKRDVEATGLRFFPQVMKAGKGIYPYNEEDRKRIEEILGEDPSPHLANRAPSYQGLRCWAGVEYFVVTQTGEAWMCRTAKRYAEGFLGNVLTGPVQLVTAPSPCPYEICPCTVPANRGMVELPAIRTTR